MVFPSLLTLFDMSYGDPTLQDNGDGTTTATWSFQNPANYTYQNVTLLPNNASLDMRVGQFIDTNWTDFQSGTVLLNVDVASDPGNVTILDTQSAGMPMYNESVIENLEGMDAWISDDSGLRNKNYGGAETLNLALMNEQRILIWINPMSIPGINIVTNAELALKLEGADSAVPMNVTVHQLNASWNEGAEDGGPSGDGVTWQSRDGNLDWVPWGGDFNPVPESTIHGIADQPTWYRWNITDLAQEWVNGTTPNYGVILIPEMPILDPLDEKWFQSKESQTGSHPRLRVDYISTEGGVANGTFVSRVMDAQTAVNWGNISWDSFNPGQTNISVQTRTGDCGGTWTSWSSVYPSSAGSQVTSPPNRCIQYRVEMETFNTTRKPILEEVKIDHWKFAQSGFVETRDFTPPNWLGWEDFGALPILPPGTNISFSYSTNGGALWSSVQLGESLQAIMSPTIRLRADLTTSNVTTSPLLQHLNLTYSFYGSLDHIHMSLASWTGTTDESVDIDAVGHDMFHNVVPFTQKWETTDPLGSVDALGVYNPGMAGSWRVYCNNTIDSIWNYTVVNVLPGSIARIAVNPWIPGVMTTDDTQMFDAIGLDSMGNLIGPVNVTWSVTGGIGTIPIGPSTSALFDATTPGFGTVNADDGNGHTNTTSMFQVVEGSLDRIVVQPDGITLQMGELQDFTATGYDADGNVVPLNNPVWDSNAGNITSSTPTSATLEAHNWEVPNGWINITAPFQNNITGVAYVQVIPPNNPPMILGTIPDQLKPEDYGSWSLDLSPFASDAEDPLAMLTWTFTGHDPSLVTITGDEVMGNHNITFTTINNAFGENQVTIWLRDTQGYVDGQAMTINISSVNDRPTIQSITPFTIHYDDPYTYYFYDYVSDIETAKEDLVLNSSDPDHISFSGLWGEFNYPEEFDGTTQYPIITVQDEDGGEMSTVLGITVSDDYVPELNKELPDVILYEGEVVNDYFDLDDYFSDPDGDSLFFASGNVQTEIVIHSNHSVDFIAPDDWHGVEVVSFRAIDPANARAEDIVLVTVLPVNDPPKIEGAPDLVVHYDDPSRPSYNYTFDLEPYIEDVDNTLAELTVTTSDPTHLFFNETKTTIMEVHYPQSMMGQTVAVRITVSDGMADGYQDINITILDDWPPEVVSSIPEFTFFEDTTLPSAFKVGDYFADNDADDLTYSAISSNVIVSIDNLSLQVDLSAAPDWFGYEYVTFRAKDPSGAIAEETTKVNVLPVNDAPEILDIPDVTLQVGEILTIDLTDYIFDIDNDLSDLVVFVLGDNTKTTRTIAGFVLILSYPTSGTDHIHVEVSDGNLTTHGYFDVRIISPAPTIWDQIYWPWSLVVAVLALIIMFIVGRELLAKIHIDEVFLIYRNGSLIHHSVVGEQTDIDEDIFSNMLTAIQEFIRDSFKEIGDSRVRSIEFGSRNILIERGDQTYLAVVYTGHENRRNLKPVEEAISEIEMVYEKELEDWDGFILRFAGVQAILQKHLGDLKKGQKTGELQRRVMERFDDSGAEDTESVQEQDDISEEGS